MHTNLRDWHYRAVQVWYFRALFLIFLQVVIFSHGMYACPELYQIIAEHLASYGFLVRSNRDGNNSCMSIFRSLHRIIQTVRALLLNMKMARPYNLIITRCVTIPMPKHYKTSFSYATLKHANACKTFRMFWTIWMSYVRVCIETTFWMEGYYRFRYWDIRLAVEQHWQLPLLKGTDCAVACP